MIRFLRYAVEHDRKIRAVFLLDGSMVQKTVAVVSYTEESAVLRIGARKTVNIPLSDLFSCDYARGDHGED